MSRLSLDFQRFKLFNDEEDGDTYVAVYAVIRDANNNELATFASNFGGRKINESDLPYGLTDVMAS